MYGETPCYAVICCSLGLRTLWNNRIEIDSCGWNDLQVNILNNYILWKDFALAKYIVNPEGTYDLFEIRIYLHCSFGNGHIQVRQNLVWFLLGAILFEGMPDWYGMLLPRPHRPSIVDRRYTRLATTVNKQKIISIKIVYVCAIVTKEQKKTTIGVKFSYSAHERSPIKIVTPRAVIHAVHKGPIITHPLRTVPRAKLPLCLCANVQ